MVNYLDRLKRFEKNEPQVPARTVSTGEPVTIEPAMKPDGSPLTPVYWERAGAIVGPGLPEFLAKVGDGPSASFWIVAQYENRPIWVNAVALRSRKQFEAQRPLTAVELIREPK